MKLGARREAGARSGSDGVNEGDGTLSLSFPLSGRLCFLGSSLLYFFSLWSSSSPSFRGGGGGGRDDSSSCNFCFEANGENGSLFLMAKEEVITAFFPGICDWLGMASELESAKAG